jgi:hypothetical protein
MNPSNFSVNRFENLPYDVYEYVLEKFSRIFGKRSREVNGLLCTLHDLSTHHLRIDFDSQSAPMLNEVTRYLSKLPNLNSIHLVNSNDIEMGSLLVERAGLTRLVVMNFPGDHGPLAPQALASCVDLRCLALQCVSLGALDSLTALSSLSHITLYLMYRINDIGPLSACKKLVSLSIMMCPGITDFEPLRAMTGLTSFGLVCNPVIVSPLEALANHPSLSAATLVALNGPVDYSLIATCSQLKTLKLDSRGRPLNIGWIGQLTALTSLDLRGCGVDIGSFEALTSCSNLRRLDVRECLLAPERFTCLDACTQLSTLFCDVDIVVRGIQSFRGYVDVEKGYHSFLVADRMFWKNLEDGKNCE